MKVQNQILPHGLPPRALTREQAAAYANVSPTKFDDLVREGKFPKPVRFGRCVRWDVVALNKAWDALSGFGERLTNDEELWLKTISNG